MRDLVLVAFIIGSLPVIVYRPKLGVAMYVWVSVMNPHRLTFGFAHEMGFASMVAAATLIGVPFSKEVKWPPFNMLTVALVSFLAWTGVSTFFSLHPAEAYSRWETLMKTGLMTLLIPMLYHRKEDLRLLIWVLVGSLAYYGVKGGIWTLATGGAAKVWGPEGSYIEDNNYLAVALVMTIPLMRYLQLTTTRRWLRWALLGSMLSCGVAVLGTYSRGALLAIVTMGFFFWWKGRHKLAVLTIAVIALPVALSSMPEKWYERMETIQTYEEDASASMRLNAWGTMWNLAKDRPLFGAGFEVATPDVYHRYAPDPSFPPQVAHSIYFQALGEHGFVGFALYLWLLAATWWSAGRVLRAHRAGGAQLDWAGEFAKMLQVALAGYAVGGAFLSLVNFDVPYYLTAIMAAVAAIVSREQEAARHEASARQVPAWQATFKPK